MRMRPQSQKSHYFGKLAHEEKKKKRKKRKKKKKREMERPKKKKKKNPKEPVLAPLLLSDFTNINFKYGMTVRT